MSGNKAVTGFILVYCWLYNVTIGATAYVAMSEISTSRLRAKMASIALLFQSVRGTFWSFILPFIFNPDKGSTLTSAGLPFITFLLHLAFLAFIRYSLGLSANYHRPRWQDSVHFRRPIHHLLYLPLLLPSRDQGSHV